MMIHLIELRLFRVVKKLQELYSSHQVSKRSRVIRFQMNFCDGCEERESDGSRISEISSDAPMNLRILLLLPCLFFLPEQKQSCFNRA